MKIVLCFNLAHSAIFDSMLHSGYSLFVKVSIFRFNPFRTNDISIKLQTIQSGWSIVYIKGPQFIFSKNMIFLSLKIDFVLENSADPDKMAHYVAFCLGHHCLPKYSGLQRVKIGMH